MDGAAVFLVRELPCVDVICPLQEPNKSKSRYSLVQLANHTVKAKRPIGLFSVVVILSRFGYVYAVILIALRLDHRYWC